MSPFTVFVATIFLCAMAQSGVSAAPIAKADVKVETDADMVDILKKKVAEYLGKADSIDQEVCILEIAAKPVLTVKVLKFDVNAGKTAEEVKGIKDKVVGRVESLTPEQKNKIKSRAVSWLKSQVQALENCLTI